MLEEWLVGKFARRGPPWSIAEASPRDCVIEDPCIMNRGQEHCAYYGNLEQCNIDIYVDL